MTDERQLLTYLADGRFHSGEALAENLGISRAGVWKRLQQLQQTLDIELHAVSGKGYKLAYPLQLLDAKKIRDTIRQNFGEDVLPEVEVHLSLDSTNRRALEQARKSPHTPRLVLAERQTAGRGRRGREWLSPFGRNLYLSLYWWFESMPEAVGSLSLLMAVALARCLEANGVPRCELKWPNDVRYQGKKLAGILLEMQGEAGGGCGIVIGMGVNLDMRGAATSIIDQPWTDVAAATGTSVDRNAFAGQLAASLIAELNEYSQKKFFACLAYWQERDVLYQQSVRLELPHEKIDGIAKGIDDQGALLLECNGSIRRFVSGDVSVRLAD